MREQGAGSAGRQRVVDLRCHVAVVERRGDEPGLETGQVVNDQRGPIRHQRSNSIAGLQSEPKQVLCQVTAEAVEHPPRQAGLSRDQSETVWILIEPGPKPIAYGGWPLQCLA